MMAKAQEIKLPVMEDLGKPYNLQASIILAKKRIEDAELYLSSASVETDTFQPKIDASKDSFDLKQAE